MQTGKTRTIWMGMIAITVFIVLMNVFEVEIQTTNHKTFREESLIMASISLQGDLPTDNSNHKVECSYKLSGHREARFIRPNVCFEHNEVLTIFRELAFEIAALMEAHNLTYFLDSGTLLGSFRSGDVIKHDHDVDIGVPTATLTYLQQNRVAISPGYHLDVFNSTFPISNCTRDDKIPIRLIHKKSALYVDVFVFDDRGKDKKNGRLMIGPEPSYCYIGCAYCKTLDNGFVQLKVPYDWIYPTKPCTFAKRTFPCPANPQAYLKYLYGPNYMIPLSWR